MEITTEVIVKSPYLTFDGQTGTYTFKAEQEFKEGRLTRKYLTAKEAIWQVRKYEAGKKQLRPNEKFITF